MSYSTPPGTTPRLARPLASCSSSASSGRAAARTAATTTAVPFFVGKQRPRCEDAALSASSCAVSETLLFRGSLSL